MSSVQQPFAQAESVRLDRDSGAREDVAFIDSRGSKIFGVTHLPAGRPRGGVLVCSPIKSELMKNYRREVLLSRALARCGIAVQRFQYRGAGNSHGNPDSLSFETMVEDAQAAMDRLRDCAGIQRPAFVGTRLGGLVAAAAATRFGGAPLVLWEPVTETAPYFREVFRARMIGELKAGTTKDRPSASSLVDELMNVGFLDVLGYSIDRALYESMKERSLLAELGNLPRPILLVQMSRMKRLRGNYARLLAQLEPAGFELHTELVEEEEAWWFQDTEAPPEMLTQLLVTTTSDWICGNLSNE